MILVESFRNRNSFPGVLRSCGNISVNANAKTAKDRGKMMLMHIYCFEKTGDMPVIDLSGMLDRPACMPRGGREGMV